MPGTPATTARLILPRYANTDTSDFAGQVNAVSDQLDAMVPRFESGLATARPAAGIANRLYWSTDTGVIERDTGSAWASLTPSAHASRHQDGGADPLTVREAMMATGATGLARGAFFAYRNAAVSLADSAVVVFDTEQADVSNWFDPATGRFTPQVPGYYAFSWSIKAGAALAADVYWSSSLRKNASIHTNGQLNYQRGAAAAVMSQGNSQAVANGTTDFFDVIVQHGVGAAQSIAAAAPNTFFCGRLIGRS